MSEHQKTQNRQGRGRNNNRGNQQNRSRQRYRGPRRPKPLKLNRWQKFLKALGLFNEEKARAKQKKAHQQGGQNKKNNHSSEQQRDKKPAPPRQPRKSNPDSVESPRLYVGNLSFDANEMDLEDLFKGVGTVREVEIVYNRNTHRSKGYAFLNMQSVEEAKRAVEVLHNQPFMGRNLIVNGAQKKDEKQDFVPSENAKKDESSAGE